MLRTTQSRVVVRLIPEKESATTASDPRPALGPSCVVPELSMRHDRPIVQAQVGVAYNCNSVTTPQITVQYAIFSVSSSRQEAASVAEHSVALICETKNAVTDYVSKRLNAK